VQERCFLYDHEKDAFTEVSSAADLPQWSNCCAVKASRGEDSEAWSYDVRLYGASQTIVNAVSRLIRDVESLFPRVPAGLPASPDEPVSTDEPGCPEWERYMTGVAQGYWMRHCDHTAKLEGWSLFRIRYGSGVGTLQIQALDEPDESGAYLEGRDGEAYDLCCRKALDGSRLHALALFLAGKEDSPDLQIPRALLEHV
jgi:hypothetical protein